MGHFELWKTVPEMAWDLDVGVSQPLPRHNLDLANLEKFEDG
jgi:hypothetical protein